MNYKENYEEALEKISHLEDKLEEKDILIDSLIAQIKKYKQSDNLKKKIDTQSNKRVKEEYTEDETETIQSLEKTVSIPDISSNKIIPNINDDDELEAGEIRKENTVDSSHSRQTSKSIMSKEMRYVDKQLKLEKEISKETTVKMTGLKALQKCPRKKEICFKSNYSFEEFIDFIDSQIVPYIFDEKKKIRLNKTLKNYIEINIKGIINLIIKTLNDNDVEKVYTILLTISIYSSYEIIILLFHDILLYLEDPSKLLFFSYAIFYDCEIRCDIISTTIKKILNYQLNIDYKLYKEYKQFYNKIENSISLTASSTDFIPYILSLESNFNINDEESVINIAAVIRMITIFMDYDWAYNELIVNNIYPKYVSTKNIFYLVCIGTVALQGQRMFEDEKSVKNMYDFIKKEYNECNQNVKEIIKKYIARFEIIEKTEIENNFY
ncbi:hypothetical protein SLOPH_1776 [Spraguea lophii 42_110]|uniref:Uncharacterized protein n=1 Tax=Spraguea lophii (strain 42_110) TaxID=1358809 RepID=S7WBX3_SPRLO|nr:hypothetical protein SLOPH_1776 [Spraguea lophii 42_110]